MYGGAGKLGRGGGNRGSTPLPSSFRQQTPSLRRHPSAAGPHGRSAASSSSAPPASGAAEESFSLVRENPLDFAVIIRLAPDLVDEIRRAEERGDGARIRFDANANNPFGNVIDVGGKNFRFTWSREVGDLCDIYEERQSGEDGDGLLVESGCAWRKLNVQRVLDESTKNHVKKRSEEAERQQKSRKAIILDHGNPSMKNQMKALAAAETTPWRKFQQKKEPEFKKRKIDPPPVAIGGPAKSVYKTGVSSTTTRAGRPSISPSPPQYSGAPASPFITGGMTKGHMSAEDPSNQANMKENVITLEKERFNKAPSSIMQEKPERKGNIITKSADLQSILITLLTENPKGMSLKALEKAVGDSVPNSVKKIEPIIKKIARFQAPGRYILKPGVELGSVNRHLYESGSSPDDNGQQTPVEEKHEGASTPAPNFAPKTSGKELEKQTLLNLNLEQEMNSFDNDGIQHRSPDIFGEKKIPNNVEGPVCSSSNTGSDSDSESNSSDSGSDSRSKSRSKSKSPIKSGSVSSSDSESDASSNSKQGPDEDVDIMTSDDEDPKPNTQISEPKFSTSPIPFKDFDASPIENGYEEKQDVNGSDIVEIEHDVPDDVHCTVIDPNMDPHSGYMYSKREYVANDVSEHDRSRIPERASKSKSKRASDSKPPHEKSGRSKKLKAGKFPEPHLSQPRGPILSESPHVMSSERVVEETFKIRSSQVTNKVSKDESAYSGFNKSENKGFSTKSSMDHQDSGRRPSDPSERARAFDAAERSNILSESLDFGINTSGKNNKSQDHLSLQEDGVNSNFRDDNRRDKEGNLFGERTPVRIGRGKMLQRELSELELGEFREPLPEKTAEEKRFERKSSFKETGNKPSSSDYWNLDSSQERPTIRPGVLSNTDGPSKRIPDNHTEDVARAPSRMLQSQAKSSHHPLRVDRAEVGSRKSGDTSGKIRHNEARENPENGVGGLGDVHLNLPVSASKQNDAEREPVSHPKRGSKTQNVNSFSDPGEVKKDASLTESSEGVVKRRESSSDENSCSFSKYEKEEPELKGPIKDFSQYKEYVQEYQGKYDSYGSLNKTLESYRNEFSKLGKDLESAKGRDVEKYYQILEQLQESYRQCGNRHKRLKKIFVVLHEELKYLKQAIKDFAASYARE